MRYYRKKHKIQKCEEMILPMSINKKHKLIILIATVAVVLCALTAVLVFLSCKSDKGNSSSSLVDSADSSSLSSAEVGKSTQLLKPKNVRVENGVLKWNTVKNADYYIISYLDEEIEVEITEFSVVEIFNKHGEIYIRIGAASRQNDVKTSDFAGCYLTNENVGGGDWAPGLEFALLPDGKGYSVSAVDAFKCSGIITIPSTHNGKTVTKIEDKAFYAIEITISAKILCNPNITAFEIPNTITEIGEEAFCGCIGVKEMVIPESCVIIGKGAFAQMTGLEDITFPSDLEELPSRALVGCKIKNVNLPQNLKSIGGSAFSACYDLETIVLPDSLEVIGERAFNSCTALKSIKLPTHFKEIGEEAFAKSGIEFVEFPNSLETIGRNAFNQCESLIGVRINENLNNIGTSVFGSCIRLAEIINESSVDTKTLLADKTGAITDRLLVNKNGGASQIKKENGFYIFDGNDGKTLIAPINKTIENAILPNGVTVIRRNAFSYCKNLKSVYYPSTLKTVEKYAFRDCNKLKEISADDVAVISSVEYEDSSAFGSNLDLVIKGEKITELVIPASIKEIKDYTFKWFSKITIVRFDGAVTLGKDSFGKQVKYVYVKNKELLSGNIKESGLLSRLATTLTLLIEEDTSKAYFYNKESWWSRLSDERKAPASGKTVYYYSETQPTTSGNYWYFDGNGAVAVW